MLSAERRTQDSFFRKLLSTRLKSHTPYHLWVLTTLNKTACLFQPEVGIPLGWLGILPHKRSCQLARLQCEGQCFRNVWRRENPWNFLRGAMELPSPAEDQIYAAVWAQGDLGSLCCSLASFGHCFQKSYVECAPFQSYKYYFCILYAC